MRCCCVKKMHIHLMRTSPRRRSKRPGPACHTRRILSAGLPDAPTLMHGMLNKRCIACPRALACSAALPRSLRLLRMLHTSRWDPEPMRTARLQADQPPA
eukprot:767968-Hanusia_phi.AAC.7